jgi:hypothetical protein
LVGSVGFRLFKAAPLSLAGDVTFDDVEVVGSRRRLNLSIGCRQPEWERTAPAGRER